MDFVSQRNSIPTDIEAFYYAGKLGSAGSADLLYAASRGPESLPRTQAIARLGAPANADPFFYPPLWAAIFSTLAERTNPAGFSDVLYVIQIPLIPATALLVWRIVQTDVSAPLWLVATLALVGTSLIGQQAVLQNQIQILLTFLIVLAFERELSGQPRVAGCALAIAASIKLFPALLVAAWIVRSKPNTQAAIAFAVAGGILGLLSIALASPLTRAHHYLLVLYFLPALVALRQGRTGWLLVICIVIVIESTFNLRLNYLPVMVQTGMVAGVAAMLTAIAAFAFSSGKPRGDQAAQRVSDK